MGSSIAFQMAKLRQSESDKQREIDNLRLELSKAFYRINQMEEEIQRDEQLLNVRCELINSLQTNERDYHIQMENMYAQIGEKTNSINEVGY